jgi:hypothetical protein
MYNKEHSLWATIPNAFVSKGDSGLNLVLHFV